MNSFCKIFVCGDFDYLGLLKLISDFYGLQPSRELLPGEFEISIIANPDYNHDLQSDFPDGFLYFPFCIEIEFISPIREEVALRALSDLLNYLWNVKASAVAAWSHEHLLPNGGGYKCDSIPWPK